ncbi:MAG TPA: metallophosphoesterase [Firmicutes bacterium]|nr:metallophosphoesterase [Candidatus Fermentithermobacillaceae bacterium]
MLIGILSDTHGNLSRLEACIQAMPDVELLLHAGDFYEDARKVGASLGIRVVAVTGNCDYMVKGPSEEMLAVGSRRIYLTHGHLYHVKRDLTLLVQRSKALGADVTVFGHTHVPVVFRREGILFVNPGSPHSPREAGPSFALLDVTRSGISAEICPLKIPS